MAYDIFDTYKKRLNESVGRFDDVEACETCNTDKLSREEMFDTAFNNVYGIDLEESTALTEDFGNFPDWLKKFLVKRKDVKERLTKMGVDLARATFISGQLPRNARDPAFKDPTRVAVFRMVDRVGGKYEVIYIPGITDPDVYPSESNQWERWRASAISKKKLLELTLEYGYIDMNDSRNSNLALRKERSDAKRDMVVRDRAAGQTAVRTNVEYGKDERGYNDFNNIVSYDIKWVTKRGYDKSGYKLDPDKYGRMLDDAGLENYSVRLEMLNKKLEGVRSRIIALFQQYTARDSANYKSKDSWDNGIYADLSRVTQDFSRAITAYVTLEKSIDSILKRGDEEGDNADWNPDRRIAYTFKWEGKRVRDYIADCTDLLKKIESPEKLQ